MADDVKDDQSRSISPSSDLVQNTKKTNTKRAASRYFYFLNPFCDYWKHTLISFNFPKVLKYISISLIIPVVEKKAMFQIETDSFCLHAYFSFFFWTTHRKFYFECNYKSNKTNL